MTSGAAHARTPTPAPTAAPAGPVERWFGPRFAELHPLLQALHRRGGRLAGTVDVRIPSGLAGLIGRRLARRLSVPTDGSRHALVVTISHQADGLHWDRCFDDRVQMRSLFQPLGEWPSGHWLEHTGPLAMQLTVDTIAGGWHWRCLRMAWGPLPLPVWLFPKSRAFKTIEDGRYRFFVGFSMPVIGTVLSYSGLLDAELV